MRMRKLFAPDVEGGSAPSEPAALTVDQAVAKLGEQRAEQAKAAEKPVKAETPREPEEKEIEPAPDGDAREPAEAGEEEIAAVLASEQTPAADTKLPPGWSEAERELWSSLTPELQAKLEKREKDRDAGIRKRLSEADATKKAADQLTEQLKAERQKLAPALQSTQQVLMRQIMAEFPDVNPSDPNAMARLAFEHPERKVAFDARMQQLAGVMHEERQHEAQRAKEADEEHQKFSDARVARLLELDESLKDPKASQAFETEVVGYLMEDNPYGKVAPERIKFYTAEELAMARDAMRYRKAMAALKKAPTANIPKVVKPGVGKDSGSTGEVAALEKRLKKTGSIDDAIALRKARLAVSA